MTKKTITQDAHETFANWVFAVRDTLDDLTAETSGTISGELPVFDGNENRYVVHVHERDLEEPRGIRKTADIMSSVTWLSFGNKPHLSWQANAVQLRIRTLGCTYTMTVTVHAFTGSNVHITTIDMKLA